MYCVSYNRRGLDLDRAFQCGIHDDFSPDDAIGDAGKVANSCGVHYCRLLDVHVTADYAEVVNIRVADSGVIAYPCMSPYQGCFFNSEFVIFAFPYCLVSSLDRLLAVSLNPHVSIGENPLFADSDVHLPVQSVQHGCQVSLRSADIVPCLQLIAIHGIAFVH